MSRLIVKNLPKHITEDKIRQLFGEKGTVTDVQLKYTEDGKFRQFAFVGYHLDNEAQDAIKYFDKSFIDSSKIRVESCAVIGDGQKPRAWSKYAPDSTTYKKKHKTPAGTETSLDELPQKSQDKTTELLDKYKDDPLFEEFLQVHAPEETKKLHSILEDRTKAKQKGDESETVDDNEGSDEKLANQAISDLEYKKQLMTKTKEKTKKQPKNFNLFTLKLRNLPYARKKKDIKDFFKPLTPFSIRMPRTLHEIAYIGFKKERDFKKALLKDKSFIGGKQISVTEFSSSGNEIEGATNQKNGKWCSQEEALKNEEDIAESGKIFFRNLSYSTTEDTIHSLFSKFGLLTEVTLPVDATTNKIKGFGTVTFVMPEDAVKAYEKLDHTLLHGRTLHLLPAKNYDKISDKDPVEESSNFKKKKASQQKDKAGSSHNWNSLFLGHDAVAEVMADTYGTSKQNVLGIEDGGGSAAVKLALGETEIVAQTRKYLEKEGVVLDAFSTPTSKRSNKVLLVKNLPPRTELAEIRTMFAKFGTLGRVLLPPSCITALVEFLEPSEAKKAYMSLAYTKFKYTPLYLEWAPENTLLAAELKPQVIEKEEDVTEKVVEEEAEEVIEEEPEDDTTLFVKNLNFKTTDEGLKKHFEECGKIFSATVATKKDKIQGKLSMGYGFVRFIHKRSADKALKTLQQSDLDGKSLELKRSERNLGNEVNTARKTSKKTKQTGTKILVRNVPFQANSKEIRQLFSTFGEIKALRLPKKMALNESSHRGFAFIDFVTNSDAKNAFEALSQSTHLYGRRLVLEWASTEEGVEEIRKRTADHFYTPDVVKSKKSVFSLD